MVEEDFLIAENDELLFAVKNDYVFQIVVDRKIHPLPFSQNYVGGFFLNEEFLIPVFFIPDEGFGEYSGTLLILNWQGNYLSIPIKRVLEFSRICTKPPKDIKKNSVFSEEVDYKGLFEIPVLDIEKLYKLTGFN